MAFRFKLETLLAYRRNLEEQAQQILAHEMLILENQRGHLAALQADRLRLIREFEEKKREKLPSSVFLFYMESLRTREQEIHSQRSAVEAQAGRVEEKRAHLAEMMKERKVIGRAREKDYQIYLQEMLRREGRENDELVILRHGRSA